MASVLTLMIIVTLSILTTRVATLALIHTGLSGQVAKFQARSALTGVGFATRESEKVVTHPVRRRIIMVLMLLGNVGIISVLASLVLTFLDEQASTLEWTYRLAALTVGLGLLWWVSSSAIVDQWLSRWVNHLLKKYTEIDVKDFSGLLHLSNGYKISEMMVEKDHWMTGKTLTELKLRQEGLNLLGIEKNNGNYIGLPHGDMTISDGDLLILYGKDEALSSLNKRRRGMAGRREHRKAIAEQQKREKEDEIAARGVVEDTKDATTEDVR